MQEPLSGAPPELWLLVEVNIFFLVYFAMLHDVLLFLSGKAARKWREESPRIPSITNTIVWSECVCYTENPHTVEVFRGRALKTLSASFSTRSLS